MGTEPEAAADSNPLYLTNIDEAVAFGFQLVGVLIASVEAKEAISPVIVFPAAPPADSVLLPVPGVRHDDAVKRQLQTDLQALVRGKNGPPIVLFISPASKVEPSTMHEETQRPAFDGVSLDVMQADDHRVYFAEVEWKQGEAANLRWNEVVGPKRFRD